MFQITQLLSTSKSHQSLAHCWTTAVAAADVRLFFHHSFRLSSDHTRVVAPISPAQSPSQRPRPPRPPSPSRPACAASRRSWCSARTCTDDDRVQIDIKWPSDKGVRANKANLDLKWIHTSLVKMRVCIALTWTRACHGRAQSPFGRQGWPQCQEGPQLSPNERTLVLQREGKN